MHIPLRAGLVGKDGSEIIANKITGGENDGDLLHLVKRKHTFVFHGVDSRPVVSLNRNFSAPINLEIHQTNRELAFLAANDSDPFNRWQAFQTYATKLLVAGARALAAGKAPKVDEKFLDAAIAVAINRELAPAFRALALTLPGEGELARNISRLVNPDAIHKARNALMGKIGEGIVDIFDELWHETQISGDYVPDAAQSGKRALRNILLDCGVVANHKRSENASIEQFSNASNMSDRYSGFSRIVLRHKSRKESAAAIEGFYNAYRDNPLVLDKWFAVQAMAPGASATGSVKALMGHDKFTLNNPNRARSVLASFAFANPTGFNHPSGKGYKLVVNAITTLDESNPQIAARMLTAFRNIGSLEPTRQNAAYEALGKLRENAGLSTDVAEILERIVNG